MQIPHELAYMHIALLRLLHSFAMMAERVSLEVG